MTKTDVEINVLLRDAPMMRQPLLGIALDKPYEMRSETFKELELRADGVFDCPEKKVAWIFEFQAQAESVPKTVYHRGSLERTLYHIRHPQKEVRLVIMYLTRAHDARMEPWCGYADDLEDRHFKVLYLDEKIRELKADQPDHPAVLVFEPLLEENDETLKRTAHQSYQKLKTATHDQEQQEAMTRVFESWFSLRFKELNYEEVQAMLNFGTLEETAVYKDLFAKGKVEGKAEGKAEGVEGEVTTLKGMVSFLDGLFQKGILPEDQYRTEVGRLKSRLTTLKQELARFKPE